MTMLQRTQTASRRANRRLMSCLECPIRNRSLCSALSDDELSALNTISQRRHVDAGEVIAIEGDEITAFGNIVSGVAKLTRGLDDGREQIVGLLFPSDFMGRALAQAHATVPHTIEAATDVELCVFPPAAFESVRAHYPSLTEKLLERTLDELDAAREWMLLLGRKTAPERVATFLHHIAKRCGSAGCAPTDVFDLPLTRREMADVIGLTIETVSRQITKLRRDDVIVIEGARRVVKIDMEALAERANLY